VVTDRITEFTEGGIRLESGRELDADVIVTATGLNLQLLGGITLSVDGTPGVPNLAFAIGYATSSWTLKIGLLCRHFCALLSHMDVGGYTVCRDAQPGRADAAASRLLGGLRAALAAHVAPPRRRCTMADLDELCRRREAAARRRGHRLRPPVPHSWRRHGGDHVGE
jgi:hypothetical protein